jgi:glycerol-3-phosphate dehydrogenase
MKGKEVLGVGIFLYDFVTLDRNWRIRDPERRIPRGYFISRKEILKLFPDLEEKGLTGGAVFHDGQMYSPQRLGLSFLRSAVNAGADAANYLEAVKLFQKGNRVIGVEIRDVLNEDRFEIHSRVVLNAAGGWAHRLLEKGLGLHLDPRPAFSRDLAFVVKRRPSHQYGFACPLKTKDADALLDRGGRHLFVVPWREYTLVGVWHVIFDHTPEEVSTTEEELRGYIEEVNEAYPSLGFTLDDVSMILTGLTLFGEKSKTGETTMSFGKRSRLIDHEREHHIEGLVTLIGVRATTARGMAEKAIDVVLEKLGKRGPRSQTGVTPIYGGQIDCFEDFLSAALTEDTFGLNRGELRALAHNYGSQYRKVLKYAEEDSAWIGTVGDSTVLKAEVIHAVREEMAQRLGDVVFRRTDLGAAGNPGEEAIRTCADLMAKEMRWNEARTHDELQEVGATFQRRGFLKNGDREGATEQMAGHM